MTTKPLFIGFLMDYIDVVVIYILKTNDFISFGSFKTKFDVNYWILNLKLSFYMFRHPQNQ